MLDLSEILVVSIENAVAAPMCSMRFADAGARVIKIEPTGGETARNYDDTVLGESAYFASLNRGKESVTLNLRNSDDLGLLRRILAKTDVFLRNTAPGSMERIGLSADSLCREYERLIVIDILGYGQDTEYRDMKAYDLLVQAESGLCSVTGTAEEPVKVGVSIADMGTGMNAYSAALEALIKRISTGQGTAIELAMFDTVAEWMSVPLLHYEHTGQVTMRYGMAHSSIYPYRPYACKDGAILIAVQNNEQWAIFCNLVLKREDVAVDSRFFENADRVVNREVLDQIVSGVFGQTLLSDVRARLDQAGIAYGEVRSLADLSQHPALKRQDTIINGNRTKTVASPISGPVKVKAYIPKLGGETLSIRDEFTEA